MAVDVIIPVYNPGLYLKEAIDSCMSQTYDNFNITIIDDCSEQNLIPLISKYPNINYIRNEKNSGPGFSRNVGILNTNNEFISFLDADDVWHRDKLHYSIAEFKKNKKIGMTCGNYQILDKNNRLQKPFYKRGINVDHNSLMRINYVASGSVTVKRAVMGDVGLFNKNYWIAEDYDLWIRISEKYPIKYIHRVLYYYRVGNNIGSLTKRPGVQKDHDRNIDEIKKLSILRLKNKSV